MGQLVNCTEEGPIQGRRALLKRKDLQVPRVIKLILQEVNETIEGQLEEKRNDLTQLHQQLEFKLERRLIVLP